MQITKISYTNPQYPDQLREIAHPPKVIYSLGELPKGLSVAIVGSRRPTDYGKQVTYKLAFDLASAGVTVISGLALGIDSIAHQAAIEAGGKTVAVLGNGLDKIIPPSNRNLALKILETGGGIISEYEVGMPPLKHHFPARNRIISGLAVAVVVTEADASSGSLITANFALEQNRAVMAVPGNITSLRSAGPNNLLKTGAIAVTDASDILAALDLKSPELSKPVKAKSKEEALILELLGQGHNTSPALITASGLEAAQFANIISLMEITGKVRSLGAGNWVAK